MGTMNLGIPLGVFANDPVAVGQVKAMTNMVNFGGAYVDTGNGKEDDVNRATASNAMGLYWAIQDQSKAWWSLDHAALRSPLNLIISRSNLSHSTFPFLFKSFQQKNTI